MKTSHKGWQILSLTDNNPFMSLKRLKPNKWLDESRLPPSYFWSNSNPLHVILCVTTGVGSLLFEMHSISHSVPWFVKSETQLQFYEHAVSILSWFKSKYMNMLKWYTTLHLPNWVSIAASLEWVQVKAFVSKKLWCLPETSKTVIIPRFKIVDCTFFLGPRIEFFFWLLMLASIVLLIIGAKAGGCNSNSTSTRRSTLSASVVNELLDFADFAAASSSSYNDPTTSYNSGACASLVIGSLVLVICAIAFVLIFFFFKRWVVLLFLCSVFICLLRTNTQRWILLNNRNYVYLDTIAAKQRGIFARYDKGIRSYEFCCK